jgi:tetratricopeptide (TPR) repeat protein
LLAVAYRDGLVTLKDVASGGPTVAIKGRVGEIWGLAFSPDGRLLAAGSYDKTVKVWESATLKEVRILGPHAQAVCGIAFHPDGKRLAAAGYDGTVQLWDVTTGRKGFPLKGHRARVQSVAFNQSGRLLASASHDGTVNLWETATGNLLRTFPRDSQPVTDVAFCPNKDWLASAGAEKTIKLWDVHSGRIIFHLRGHTDTIHGIAFSPNGRRLASASSDRTIKLWDLESGQELLTLCKHTDQVLGLAFSPDGRRLASASADHTVKLWEIFTDQNRPRSALVPAARELLAWHRNQATASEKEHEWFAAVWHLDRLWPLDLADRLGHIRRIGMVKNLSECQRDFQRLFWRRANAHAEMSMWDQASHDFAWAVALGPGTVNVWYGRALARLAADDLTGYRKVCERLQRRFGQNVNYQTAQTMAWICMLGPDALADYRGLVQVLERAVAMHPNTCTYYHPLGWILYRAGRPEMAIQRLRDAIKFHPKNDGLVDDWLILAMAHQRLGHADEARKWFNKASRRIELEIGQQPATDSGQQPLTWVQRAEIRILHREAQAVMKKAMGQ